MFISIHIYIHIYAGYQAVMRELAEAIEGRSETDLRFADKSAALLEILARLEVRYL